MGAAALSTVLAALQYNCCVAKKQGLLMAGPPFFDQELGVRFLPRQTNNFA
jgi:hypothetical protein